MTYDTKRKALILLGLVMLITVIISASLSQLDLRPGMPLPALENNEVIFAPVQEEPMVSVSVNEFVKNLLFLVLMVLMLFAFYQLIRGGDWKNLWSYIQPVLAVCLIAGSFIFLVMLLPTVQGDLPMELPRPTETTLVTSPLGNAPVLLLWLVGIGLLGGGIIFGVWIFLSSRRRETTVDLLGLEAENALHLLKTGQGLKDVIIKCYHQMSLALERERGIERKVSMTTGEFETLLEAAGVPHDPIHQLTRLFDAVRYGKWQPNQVDEQKALQCLEAIMLFSRETKNIH